MDQHERFFKRLMRMGADAATLDRVEGLFGVRFPDDFREFYLASDGLDSPDGRMEILSLSGVAQYGVLAEGFGYVPFVDCNDSNPYVMCCREPLIGFVAHIFHDDESRLVCRDLWRFLDLVAETHEQLNALDKDEIRKRHLRLNELAGDLAFERPERSADDTLVGRALVRHAEGLDPTDERRVEALRFAMQMFGPGDEAEMAGVLALGNEYVRAAVLRRCRCLDTPAAKTLLQRETEQFDRFVVELAKAVEEAGIEVRRQPGSPHGWTIEPGNIGLNLRMLYANRHDPDFMKGLLERIRRWQSERRR